MTTVPSREPATLRIGDTWSWQRSLPDFPAPTWTLKYRFKSGTAAGVEITAAASGTSHLVSVAAATTAGYAAGSFDWVAWVVSGLDERTIGTGRIQLLPNLRAGTAAALQDLRSDARQIYEGLVAAYKQYVTDGAMRASYSIAGRTMQFHRPADMIQAMEFWRAEVAKEDVRMGLANGTGGGNRVVVRL